MAASLCMKNKYKYFALFSYVSRIASVIGRPMIFSCLPDDRAGVLLVFLLNSWGVVFQVGTCVLHV